MNNDLISREALKKAIQDHFDNLDAYFPSAFIAEVEEAPTVEPEKAKESEIIKAYTKGFDTGVETVKSERPQDEMIETKHRLNLLIGVLFSNQLISENDIEYIEDSIKELMKGGAE